MSAAYLAETDGSKTTVRSQAFVAHGRIVVFLWVLVTIVAVAVLPSLKLPQFLGGLFLLPALFGWWRNRGTDLVIDDEGVSEMVRRGPGARLVWADVARFELEEAVPPRALRWLGRGDEDRCWAIVGVLHGGDRITLWSVSSYGSPPPPEKGVATAATTSAVDGRANGEAILMMLEARRAEAQAA